MNNPSWIRDVRTSHGPLVVEECGSGETPVLLIHGNSSCRRRLPAAARQSALPQAKVCRVRPAGSWPVERSRPMRTYTLAGLADAAIELLERLGISEVVVLGWSLGGHIGIEMMQRFPGMKGLVITGTPPVRRAAWRRGSSPRHSSGWRVAATSRMRRSIGSRPRCSARRARPFSRRRSGARTDGSVNPLSSRRRPGWERPAPNSRGKPDSAGCRKRRRGSADQPGLCRFDFLREPVERPMPSPGRDRTRSILACLVGVHRSCRAVCE